MGMSRIGADPKRCRLGRLDGAFVFMIEFCAAENGLASVVAVADRARMIGGGVGKEPPGEARRFGMMDASRDWEVWWTLEVVETVDIVDIVDTLECVGDRRSWP